MKKLLIVGVAAFALVGAANAETRNLTGFTSVNAADRIAVEITMGERHSVRVEGPDASKVQTRVENGDELRIRRTTRPWFGGTPRTNATVYITVPAIEGIAASRGASIEARDITATRMSIAAAMGGVVEITGTCTMLDAAAAMGAEVNATAFQCQTADVAASMGGTAQVFAARHMDAAASMGGAISNAGGATAGDDSTAMGGSVSR